LCFDYESLPFVRLASRIDESNALFCFSSLSSKFPSSSQDPTREG
jgi:hypothetical protein